MTPPHDETDVTIGELYRLVQTMSAKLDALTEGSTKDRLAIAALVADQRSLGVVVKECPVSRDRIVSGQIGAISARVTELESQTATARWVGLSLILGILGTLGYWVKQAIEHALMRTP